MRKVDDNENSVFKHDQFLMAFQVFSGRVSIQSSRCHLLFSLAPIHI